MKLNSQSTVLFGIWRLRVKKKQIPKRCGLGMDHRGHWPEDLQELVTYKWGGGGRKRSREKVLMEEDVDHTLDERERRPLNPQELGKWLTTLGPSVSNSRENCLCVLDPFSFLGFKEQRHGAVFVFESQREAWMRPLVLSSNWAAKVQGSWVAASLPKMNW